MFVGPVPVVVVSFKLELKANVVVLAEPAAATVCLGGGVVKSTKSPLDIVDCVVDLEGPAAGSVTSCLLVAVVCGGEHKVAATVGRSHCVDLVT